MFVVLFGAVRARSAQAATVLVLTVLAVMAAVAGPWYALAAERTAAAADVAAAPAVQRTLSVRQINGTSGDPEAALDNFRSSVRRSLPLPEQASVVGMNVSMGTIPGGQADGDGTFEHEVAVAYREQVCQHVRLVGACPSGPGEALVSAAAAETLGVDVGDDLVLHATPTSPAFTVHLVGRYELLDPAGSYWSEPLFRSSDELLDPVFVAQPTFRGAALLQPTMVYDATIPDRLLRGDGGYDLGAVLRSADYRLGLDQLHLVNPAGELLDQIAADRAAIRRGVLVAAAIVLVLSWLSLGIAGRATASARRPDVALLKLRGTTRWAMLRLALGQQILPVLAGLLIGAPLGFLAAWALAGRVSGSAEVRAAALLSLVAAGAALLGAFIALAVAEVGALRSPVVLLLRAVPPRRRGWRADVLDLAVVAVAVAGAYQAVTTKGALRGLAILAPVLVALAVGVLLARLLTVVTGRFGASRLPAGRLRFGLTALQLSRRPGTDRVLALVIVAVATLATAADGFAVGADARADRAAVELGAGRVLTVQAADRAALIAAVHAADPAGRTAMAAVVNTAAEPPVLAVEADRLAAVSSWRDAYGPLRAAVAALARPAPAAVTVTGSGLAMRVRNNGTAPVGIVADLANQRTGRPVTVFFGPVPTGEQQPVARVDGCADGCRLLSIALTDPDRRPPVKPASVTISGLTQDGPAGTVLDATGLGDITRWQGGPTGRKETAVTVSGTPDGLGLAVSEAFDGMLKESPPDARALVIDAPLPLPIVVAGAQPATWALGDATLSPFGGGALPVRVARGAAVLPVVGRHGVLVDLASAERAGEGTGAAGTLQVWLTGGARPALIDRLRAAGLVVLSDEAQSTLRHRLAEHGPAVAGQFQLLAAVVTLLLAAGALGVATIVARDPRAEELGALRVQGLPGRVATGVALAGPALLVVAGVLGGLLAAGVARLVVGFRGAFFVDGWAVVDTPLHPRPLAYALTAIVALAVLGGIGAIVVRPMLKRLGA